MQKGLNSLFMCLTYERRSTLEMARRNLESIGKFCDNTKTASKGYNTSKSRRSPVQGPVGSYKSGSQSPEPKHILQRTVPLSTSPPRTNNLSPVLKPSSPSESKQYAGCKWTEPPSPSTLPHPPQHWMQSTSQPFFARPFQHICQPEQDIAKQLKVLLKVQA